MNGIGSLDPVLGVAVLAVLGVLGYVGVRVVGRQRRQRRPRSQAAPRPWRGAGGEPEAARAPVRSDGDWERQFRENLEKVEGPPQRDEALGEAPSTGPEGASDPSGYAAPSDPPGYAAPSAAEPASRPHPASPADPASPAPPPASPASNGAPDPPPVPPPSDVAAGTNGAHDGGGGHDDGSGTLELLPGRLQPLQGTQAYEVRFVRRPGRNVFTLGRQQSTGPDHIQIGEPTVSRVHAAMEYVDGRWFVANHSGTNPVHVNGAPVRGQEGQPLGDGDRLDMGEAAFVFRAH